MMQFLSNIDWNQFSIYWLLFEQIIAASDAKQNSSFEIVVSLVNKIVSFLPQKTPVVPIA
jgi:abortive infection bacteriophage resistance protein